MQRFIVRPCPAVGGCTDFVARTGIRVVQHSVSVFMPNQRAVTVQLHVGQQRRDGAPVAIPRRRSAAQDHAVRRPVEQIVRSSQRRAVSAAVEANVKCVKLPVVPNNAHMIDAKPVERTRFAGWCQDGLAVLVRGFVIGKINGYVHQSVPSFRTDYAHYIKCTVPVQCSMVAIFAQMQSAACARPIAMR